VHCKRAVDCVDQGGMKQATQNMCSIRHPGTSKSILSIASSIPEKGKGLKKGAKIGGGNSQAFMCLCLLLAISTTVTNLAVSKLIFLNVLSLWIDSKQREKFSKRYHQSPYHHITISLYDYMTILCSSLLHTTASHYRFTLPKKVLTVCI
jgi:hypothetical protein